MLTVRLLRNYLNGLDGDLPILGGSGQEIQIRSVGVHEVMGIKTDVDGKTEPHLVIESAAPPAIEPLDTRPSA